MLWQWLSFCFAVVLHVCKLKEGWPSFKNLKNNFFWSGGVSVTINDKWNCVIDCFWRHWRLSDYLIMVTHHKYNNNRKTKIKIQTNKKNFYKKLKFKNHRNYLTTTTTTNSLKMVNCLTVSHSLTMWWWWWWWRCIALRWVALRWQYRHQHDVKVNCCCCGVISLPLND